MPWQKHWPIRFPISWQEKSDKPVPGLMESVLDHLRKVKKDAFYIGHVLFLSSKINGTNGTVLLWDGPRCNVGGSSSPEYDPPNEKPLSDMVFSPRVYIYGMRVNEISNFSPNENTPSDGVLCPELYIVWWWIEFSITYPGVFSPECI